MSKPTTEELQEELAQVIQKHNDAQKIVDQMKHRFTEIQAILNDRKAAEVVIPDTAPAPEQAT